MEAGKAAPGEQWWRDWQAASQRVDALAAQLADEELSAATRAVGFRSDLMGALKGEEARRTLDEGLMGFDVAYERANAMAGRMIHAIDTYQPAAKGPTKERGWL